MNHFLYPYIFLLFPILLLFIIIILVINRFKGYIEEELLGEIRIISPALKIVKLLFSKIINSVEIIIIFLSIYLLTIMASFTTSYTYSMKTINLDGEQYLFDVIGVSNTIDVIDKIRFTNYTITIIQVFNTITLNINNESLFSYPLLIECSNSVESISNTSKDIEMLMDLCKFLENHKIILNIDLAKLLQEITIGNSRYNVIGMDIKPLLNIKFIPSLYIVHSIGSIGGTAIKLEDINKLAIFRFSRDNIEILCKDECNVKIVVLYIESKIKESSMLNNIINEYKNIFDYVIVRHNSVGTIYSNIFVPTYESLIGFLLLIIISVIILLLLSGGLIEKLTYIVSKLWSIGISKELYNASVIFTLIITFIFAGIPIAIGNYIGWLNSFGFLTYISISIISIAILSTQLTRRIHIAKPPQGPSFTYITNNYMDVEKVKRCLTHSLQNDDLFYLNESEVLKNSKYFVLRLEMIYRRALSTIVSSEIYVDSYDNLWKYLIDIDIWSIEELSSRETKYITSLALSKIYGGLSLCLET